MSEFRIEWISKYLKRYPKIILDIGAAYGEDTVVFKVNFPRSRVIAFEPSLKCFQTIKSICSSNDIEFYPYAISDTDGTANFYQSSGLNELSSSIFAPTTKINSELVFNEKYSVKVVNLATFCTQHDINIEDIDFIHMDVHGCELPIMKSISPTPRIVFAETCAFDKYNCNYSKTDFIFYMCNRGYRYFELTYNTFFYREELNT